LLIPRLDGILARRNSFTVRTIIFRALNCFFVIGYTLLPAQGWYWNDVTMTGLPDDIVRIEVDGIFTGDDLRAPLLEAEAETALQAGLHLYETN
jgi:hypothetical protein